MHSLKLAEPFGADGSPMRQSPLSRKNYNAVGYKSKSHEKTRKSPSFSSFSHRYSAEPTAASASFTQLRSGQANTSHEEPVERQHSASSAARSARQLTGSDSACESPTSGPWKTHKRRHVAQEKENSGTPEEEEAAAHTEATVFGRTQAQVLQEIQPLQSPLSDAGSLLFF